MTADGHAAAARALELAERGYEAFRSGDAEESRRLNVESLELAREAGAADATVSALAGLMRLGLRARDFDAVEQLAAEAESVADDAGAPRLRRLPLHMRAEAARMRGDAARARGLYDASIELNRTLGEDGTVAVEQANKSWVEIGEGRLDDAERLLRESLDATPEDDAYGTAFCLLGLARVRLARGDESGATALGAAEAVLQQAGLQWDPAEELEHTRTVELAGAVAGERLDELRRRGGAGEPRRFAG